MGYGTTESESASDAVSTESINESNTDSADSTENAELETTWTEETTPEMITDTGVSVNETEEKK